METQPFPSSIPEGTSSSQVQPVVSNQVPQTAQVTPVQQGLPSKRYRRVVFWHKLASGIFWFFAVLFFWNSIANFLLGEVMFGFLFLGGGVFCTLTGMLFYVHTLVVYILLPVFSLITSVSILIFLLDLPYSLSDFLRIDSIVLDTVVYGMVFIIGILYIMGCIVVILQAKRLSTPLAALPLTKMSNKIQWKSSVIGVVVSLLVLLVYFIIGDIVKTYPQVPVAYFEKTLDSTLADEENGYLQLAKFVSKYKGNTIEKLSSLLEEYQGEYLIRTGAFRSYIIHREPLTEFLKKQEGLPQLMTALSQPEFYNELVTITQMKFSELDEEQPYFYSVVGFRFMESLTQALMFSSLYYTETNQPDVAMQYILLAYKLNKSFATMHTSLTDFRIALEMQKLCKNVVHYWMTKYSDVAAASEWWNVYRENDILLYLSDHYETRRQQITASEYQSLVNELQERGYKYHVHANNRLGLLYYWPFVERASLPNLIRIGLQNGRRYGGRSFISPSMYLNNMIGEQAIAKLISYYGEGFLPSNDVDFQVRIDRLDEPLWTFSPSLEEGFKCEDADITVGTYTVSACNVATPLTYYEALQICPEGYHLPTYNERKGLYEHGVQLGYWSGSEMPNVHFPDVKTFATYLHLLPTENGEFVAGGRSDYWSATQKDDSNVYALYLDTTHSFWTAYNDSTALSVRCFKTM